MHETEDLRRGATGRVAAGRGGAGGAACRGPRGAPARPAPTLHRPLSTVYDLYLGGIPVGELSVRSTVDGDRYRAISTMRTAGLLGAFYDASFQAETQGLVGADGLVPQHFAADSGAGGDRQAVDVTYAGRTPDSVRADPPFKPKPWQIEPRAQAGTLDPVSAAVTALAPAPASEICRQTVDIFDGRRRYAVDLGAPEADGVRIRCPGVYRRIAGYKKKELKEKITFNVWFEKRPDGLMHAVRGAGDSMLGLAVVLLRE